MVPIHHFYPSFYYHWRKDEAIKISSLNCYHCEANLNSLNLSSSISSYSSSSCSFNTNGNNVIGDDTIGNNTNGNNVIGNNVINNNVIELSSNFVRKINSFFVLVTRDKKQGLGKENNVFDAERYYEKLCKMAVEMKGNLTGDFKSIFKADFSTNFSANFGANFGEKFVKDFDFVRSRKRDKTMIVFPWQLYPEKAAAEYDLLRSKYGSNQNCIDGNSDILIFKIY